MRVLYIGMYSEAGLEGLESSSLAKRKEAAASIAKVEKRSAAIDT